MYMNITISHVTWHASLLDFSSRLVLVVLNFDRIHRGHVFVFNIFNTECSIEIVYNFLFLFNLWKKSIFIHSIFELVELQHASLLSKR